MSSTVPASSAEEPRSDPSAARQVGEAVSAPTRAEIEQAIATIEHSRGTHVEWAAFVRDFPDEAAKPSPRAVADVAGDLKHHEDCIDGYDHVLAVLRRIVPVDAPDVEGAPV